MPVEESEGVEAGERARRDRFVTTRWSVVNRAGGIDTPLARKALSQLCEIYWYPLYLYGRRRGFGRDDSEDLIQGFFARLLEKNFLAAADPDEGRFRGFLLTALNRHLSGRWISDRALKRSPSQTLSLDFEEADHRFRLEPKSGETPERIYERKWAATVLHEAARALRREYESRGRGEAFELLKGYLSGKDPDQNYRALAQRLETTEGMIAVMIHRLRQRYRRKIEEEIAQTVADPADITPEFEHLMRVLRVV
jgi:DNA-directed RNA polymerase specialized sigma24 family protein